MRRKAGAVLPLEEKILDTAISLRGSGIDEFHGFLLAKVMKAQSGNAMPAHGTLYRALVRMEETGWLQSTWEDPDAAESERRPRRRLYRVTLSGEEALSRARSHVRQAATARRARVGPATA